MQWTKSETREPKGDDPAEDWKGHRFRPMGGEPWLIGYHLAGTSPFFRSEGFLF